MAQTPKCKCDEDDKVQDKSLLREFIPAAVSFVMLAAGLAADHLWEPAFFDGWVRVVWYAVAYLPVELPVLGHAWAGLRRGEFFTEFTLMCVATIGAFAIGDYAEGVAVMLFYAVGELFQQRALERARGNIRALVAMRPAVAMVMCGGGFVEADPAGVTVGERVQVRAGERVPLDGVLLTARGAFDTSALTGESVPRGIAPGGEVLAGMINSGAVAEIEVTRPFEDSALSRIMEMVQSAAGRKAKPELMIRRFAKIYTPVVFALAVALALLPYFFVADYVFADWLYRALVFLVVSCPCALVISIPLGYFGGIGAASRHGILFKGSNYLDVMARVDTMVMDKTGTLTEGLFAVRQAVAADGRADELLRSVAALEAASTHPIARAITTAVADPYTATDVEEIAGFGMTGTVGGRRVLAGSTAMLRDREIAYDSALDSIEESLVACAVDGRYAGYIVVADRIKQDAAQAITDMRAQGVGLTVILSGDREGIVRKVATEVGADRAYGALMPEDKVRHVQELRTEPGRTVAFAGDGINDAPVLASADVGIAMGAMGSGAAIETADVVIQTDRPSRIATAIRIGRATRRIVFQNITLALGVKSVVLLLGALGLASMWAAVFADVGVALLAILNAVRILRMKF
ncbi:MAG: cadmium-translocating P-type ATPase [Rikenellaceae bacterium]|jgi:Cd2+/Zn2+-exporting ATPase|nr:cadmium-translocating P-type ATPase [Rikenellaceae bacterium]